MEAIVKFGNARVRFSADEYDHSDGDMIGGGDASVSVRDLRRVHKKQKFSLIGTDVEQIEEVYATGRDLGFSLVNDDFIVFMDAIRREPKRNYEISWNGLSYWLFHDIVHATYDVSGGSINVDARAENRALYEGAILARKYGVKLEQIIRELVKAEEEYKRRFQDETNALDRFLHEIDK